MGSELYKPRPTNPKGFFEDRLINEINERILACYDPENKYDYGQRWLMNLPHDVQVNYVAAPIRRLIKTSTSHEPFCFKDPRFCYTLPVWKSLISEQTVYLCIFRSPSITVKSIMKEYAQMDYLASLYLDEEKTYQVWADMYKHVINSNNEKEPVYFFHYDQIFDGSALDKLSKLLEVKIDLGFVDHKLKRTQALDIDVPGTVREMYIQLCDLAEYHSNLQVTNSNQDRLHYYEDLIDLKNNIIEHKTAVIKKKEKEISFYRKRSVLSAMRSLFRIYKGVAKKIGRKLHRWSA
ncbi:MAG: hypothetical protein GF401_19640 [Chitinivibrionales bacterium]|nr:hypothetical protein [Chitinivibrionales bacterium]